MTVRVWSVLLGVLALAAVMACGPDLEEIDATIQEKVDAEVAR